MLHPAFPSSLCCTLFLAFMMYTLCALFGKLVDGAAAVAACGRSCLRRGRF